MTSIIQRLHDSEINGEVSWRYDGTFNVRIGSPLSDRYVEDGKVNSWKAAENWLREKALEHYPASDFALEEGTGKPSLSDE